MGKVSRTGNVIKVLTSVSHCQWQEREVFANVLKMVSEQVYGV